MKKLQSEIGKRIQEIRNIYNGGFRATLEQFSTELGETKYNISNYENGKANIPPRVLVSIFEKGFNPVYVLTGIGDIYADNEKGRSLKIVSESSKSNAKIIGIPHNESMSLVELNRKASEYIAAAGDIMKLIEEKRKEH